MNKVTSKRLKERRVSETRKRTQIEKCASSAGQFSLRALRFDSAPPKEMRLREEEGWKRFTTKALSAPHTRDRREFLAVQRDTLPRCHVGRWRLGTN
jgi:hypothetical protein